MKLLLKTLAIIFCISSAYAGKHLPGQLYVKFKDLSPKLIEWEQNGRSGSINEFKLFLGENTTIPLLNDKFKKALQGFDSRLPKIMQSSKKEFNLFGIAIVKYSNSLSPEIAAKKLAGLDFVEYAEPIPEMNCNYIPNDTMFTEQYFLRKIKAPEAWDLCDSNVKILVGIVDTGVDYTHEDLYANIYENPGETGLDSNGKDKKNNGIDDDGNGFVDDWRGWDFVANTASGEDNDPMPGNVHGTHVAGIVAAMTNNVTGVAGTSINAKLLPVKCASDDPATKSVSAGYQGILYAAIAGAKVINCSWGGSGNTTTEEQILKKAESMGALVIAAAGNDGMETSFFPASYSTALSVAATDSVDFKAYFSNFHGTIGIAAPGVEILSTYPGNYYVAFDGTSMASPVVSGVAAMAKARFPDDTPVQLKERLKATSDNIDWANPSKYGKIGKGRVNAYKALSTTTPLALSVSDKTVIEQYPDLALDAGEKIEINISIVNYLSPAKNCYAKLRCNFTEISFDKDSIFFGDMATMESRKLSENFKFVVPDYTTYDSKKDFIIELYSDTNLVNRYVFNLVFYPSYRNFTSNDIKTTVNSAGSLAFNDFPSNEQGLGFSYKSSPNLLFEGALIVGDGYDKVYDCARAGTNKMRDFRPDSILIKKQPGKLAAAEGYTVYSDYKDFTASTNQIYQKVFQFNETNLENVFFVVYDVVNKTDRTIDSLCLGLYFDWDIGNSSWDSCYYDFSKRMGWVRNIKTDTLPAIAVALISKQKINFFAIDNDGRTVDNPGVYDDFTKQEKWRIISSGIARKNSNMTDISMAIGGGPVKCANGDTTRFVFALIAGSVDDINKAYTTAYAKGTKYFVNAVDYASPNYDCIENISPNPAGDFVGIDYLLQNDDSPIFQIIDLKGGLALEHTESNIGAGHRKALINVKILASGKYILSLKTKNSTSNYSLIIAK